MNRSIKKTLLATAIYSMCIACNKDECAPATISDAGEDQVIIGTSTELEGNTPESGTGTWQIVSGDGGELEDPLVPTTSFSGEIGQTYVLSWTITGCPESTDDVSVSFICDPGLAANAGPDQSLNGSSTTLAANGSGTWTIVSGDNGNIAEPNNPSSAFTGSLGTTYVLKWSVACPETTDDVQIVFNNPNPQLLTVDKTNVINGEIITVTGTNFSSNFNGGSNINVIKVGDPYGGQEIFIAIISRTPTQMKAIMQGANGGATGMYSLRYNKKPDSGAATVYPSNLSVTINAPAANQFFASSTFTAQNVSKGAEASFGIKNGSLTPGDYTVKLVDYNYVTGVATEHDVTNIAITAGGYGGSMDKLAFTIPANLPDNGIHYVKVTFESATVIGGWGGFLNIL